MKVKMVCLAILSVFMASGTVLAITNGQPDGNGHPFVGLITDGVWLCSGSLISPTVMVTAAHCFETPGQVVVASFEPDGLLAGDPNLQVGTWHPEPSGLHDVAVVVLAEPFVPVGGTYATLPSPGLVDSLPMNAEVTVVGYGVQWDSGGGPPVPEGVLTRYVAQTQLKNSQHWWNFEFLKLTANPGDDKGGICFGDSGGPDLLTGSNLMLGVNSFVNNDQCAGVTYSNRIDIPSVLGFIISYLTPPAP